MYRTFLAGMLVALLSGSVNAQSTGIVGIGTTNEFAGFKNYSAAFASQQREIDELRAQLISLETGEVYKGDDSWCNPCAGILFSAEVIWLRPQDSLPDSPTGGTLYQTGSRFTLGYLNDSGRMLRVRYFEFAHDNWDSDDLEMHTVDIEYAGRFTLGCGWNGELSGGIRLASYFDNDMEYDSAFGPVIGVEIKNEVRCGVNLVGLFRQSIQVGDELSGSSERGTFGITEIQVGTEIIREVNGFQIFLRSMLEAQLWSGIEDNLSQDMSLIGVNFSVGIAR